MYIKSQEACGRICIAEITRLSERSFNKVRLNSFQLNSINTVSMPEEVGMAGFQR
jgi:hypothetical protein